MVHQLSLLGVVLTDSSYVIVRKALAKLFNSKPPKTIKQLQVLAGKLNFAGKFIPDYKQRVKPIIDLLGSKQGNI